MLSIFLKMNVYCAAILMIASKRWQEIIEIQIEGSAVETIFLQVSLQKPSSNQSKDGKGDDGWSSWVTGTGTFLIHVAIVCHAVALLVCCILYKEKMLKIFLIESK